MTPYFKRHMRDYKFQFIEIGPSHVYELHSYNLRCFYVLLCTAEKVTFDTEKQSL